jgi:hypothetical protein
MLHFASESATTLLTRDFLEDCALSISGDAECIQEIHVMGATEKIFLKFAPATQTIAVPKDDLKKYLVENSGTKTQRRVTLYFRDAHLLTARTMAHILWKLQARIVLIKVVLTHRFTEDRAYSSHFWSLLSVLNEVPRTIMEFTDSTTTTIPFLDDKNMASFDGICIVPVTRDAQKLFQGQVDSEKLLDFNGEMIFTIKPPLFGKLDIPLTKLCRRKIECTVQFPHKKTHAIKTIPLGSNNVHKCRTTTAGGSIRPVSALLYYRERFPWMQGVATVLVPSVLDAQWKTDMIATARAFFKQVNIVFVLDESYSFEPENNFNAEGIIAYVSENAAKRIKH